MTTDVLIILAIVHAVVLGYVFFTRMQKPVTLKVGVQGATGTQAAPEAPKPRLYVEGAIQAANADKRFLKLFGLNTRPVFDMWYIQGPCSFAELNPVVANNLAQVYERGDAVGSDVMEFIHHARQLTKSQQLWFVLQSMGENVPERLTAFIDVVRPAPVKVSRPA